MGFGGASGYAKRMRVLVIDDSAPVRARLVAMLAEVSGVDGVDEASDGYEGIARARIGAPDAVVLDLQLPGLGGLDVLVKLKALRPPPLVIVLTNQSTELHRRECMARGADLYLDKSREFHRVALALREALRDPPRSDV